MNETDAQMEKISSFEEQYQDMIEFLNEGIGAEYYELKERFNKIVTRYGFDLSFEDYIKDNL